MKIKMEHASKQQLPEQSSKPFDQAARAEFDQKEILFHMMRKNKYYEKHPTHQLVYDALMQSLILDEDEMEKAKTVESPTQMKRHHDDRDQDPPTGPYQGLKKRKKIKDDKPSKKPTLAGSFKGTTQISAKIECKLYKQRKQSLRDDWFKKPTRPPTPDPDQNTRKSVDDGPEQSWLNDLANAKKPPITFDDLIMKECYRNLSNQLDWNNPKGNQCPYDLCKPLPLHKSQGRLTVPANFFFNNDLEYQRGECTDIKYTASKTKIKATKYDVEGIEDPVPKLWSPIKTSLNEIEDCASRVQNKLTRGDEIVESAVGSFTYVYTKDCHSEESRRPSTRSQKLLEEA
ncbi:hypothetical protein Tco_1431109 [Tanacetum coccineum]